MIQIPLSLAVAIAGSAEAFKTALLAHRDQLEAHRNGKPGNAAPQQHDLIDLLVERIADSHPIVAERKPDRFVIADYEIVDDTPPAPTLEHRKNALLAELQAAAVSARDALLQPAKANLLALDAAQASALPEANRSPAQRATIDAYSAFAGACSDIQHAVARVAVEIEDLTEATIENFKIPQI